MKIRPTDNSCMQIKFLKMRYVLHSAKKFLDTSKSQIFQENFCIRQIKGISGEANKCLLCFDTKFVGIG